MKKIIVAFAMAALTFGAFARPHGGPGFHGGPRFGCGPRFGGGPRFHHGPGPGFHHVPRHYHHGGFWGRGGRNFWPGFIGGVVGGVVYD